VRLGLHLLPSRGLVEQSVVEDGAAESGEIVSGGINPSSSAGNQHQSSIKKEVKRCYDGTCWLSSPASTFHPLIVVLKDTMPSEPLRGFISDVEDRPRGFRISEVKTSLISFPVNVSRAYPRI